jgi:hypothetical protein
MKNTLVEKYGVDNISKKIKIKMIKLKEDSIHDGTIEFTSSENAFIKNR